MNHIQVNILCLQLEIQLMKNVFFKCRIRAHGNQTSFDPNVNVTIVLELFSYCNKMKTTASNIVCVNVCCVVYNCMLCIVGLYDSISTGDLEKTPIGKIRVLTIVGLHIARCRWLCAFNTIRYECWCVCVLQILFFIISKQITYSQVKFIVSQKFRHLSLVIYHSRLLNWHFPHVSNYSNYSK